MSIQKVQAFLNSHNIKYTTIRYSSAHTRQELKSYKSKLGTDLIEAVLVKIEEKIAIAIVPDGLAIDIGSLQNALGTTNVKFLEPKEVASFFPDSEFGTVPPFGNLISTDVFLAQELEQKQEAAFYVDSYTDLIRMSYGDFE